MTPDEHEALVRSILAEGCRNADMAWLKDGLTAGETVLLCAGRTMADGQPVRSVD